MTSGRVCIKCAAGTFSNASNLASCFACGADEFQPYAGQGFCSKHAVCVAGERQTAAPSVTSDRACSKCAAGQFSNSSNSKSCKPCAACSNGIRQQCGQAFEGFCAACPAGRFFSTATSSCAGCPAGWWCQDGKQYVCGGSNLFCPAGSSTPTGVTIGHYTVPVDGDASKREGQLACESGSSCSRGERTECPAGRVCQLRSTAQIFTRAGESVTVVVTSQERCKDDEFVFNGTCISCPKDPFTGTAYGASCRDGRIELQPDYWFDPKHGSLTEFWGKRHLKLLPAATNIYRCAKGSCLVNGTEYPACAEGRGGTLCGVCDEGYFATNNLQCKPCPKGMEGVQIAFVLVFLALGVAVFMRFKVRLEKKHPRLAASLREKLPEVLKLCTGLLQILGAFTATLYRVPWPNPWGYISSFMGLVTMDMLALPSVRCSSFGSMFYKRFDSHVSSMLVLTFMFVGLLAYSYSSHNTRRGEKALSRTLVWNLFLPFLFIICKFDNLYPS